MALDRQPQRLGVAHEVELLDAAEAAVETHRLRPFRRRGVDHRADRQPALHFVHGFLRGPSAGEQPVEFGAGRRLAEGGEAAGLGDLPRDAFMKPAQAMRASAPPTLMRRTPSAAIWPTVRLSRPAGEHVHRLRRHRLDDRRDVLDGVRPRRIEAVGAGLGEGPPAGGSPPPAASAWPVRKHSDRATSSTSPPAASIAARAAAMRSTASRAIEQRRGIVAGRILDRQAGDAGLDAAAHVLRHRLRRRGETGEEIRVDRQVGGFDDRADVVEHRLERHGAVGCAETPCRTRTGRRQRLGSRAARDSGPSPHPTDWAARNSRSRAGPGSPAFFGNRRHRAFPLPHGAVWSPEQV